MRIAEFRHDNQDVLMPNGSINHDWENLMLPALEGLKEVGDGLAIDSKRNT